jgi:hypothetical protein
VAVKPLAVASLFVLALSACGSPSKEDVLTEEAIKASQSAPELPEINLSENPEPPPAPPPTAEPVLNEADNAAAGNVAEIETQGAIPPAFQALWARVPTDCRQGNVVGSGMLVSEDALIFADSAASLLGVLGDYPGRFMGRFGDESGFEQREELALTGSSNVLVRTSGGQRLTYRRCVAARPTG